MAKKFIGNVKGVGVASIKKQYYLSTSASELTGGEWEDDVPAVGDANYLWSRWKVVLTNTTTEYTEAVQEGVAGAELESLANRLTSLGTLLNEIAPGKTVNILHGGTGATTAAEALSNLGVVDLIYPVGVVYISYVSTSPAELFGGTWTPITGVFPYFNAGTATGGSNTHTLTTAQMPSHTHTFKGTAESHTHSLGFQNQGRGSGSTNTRYMVQSGADATINAGSTSITPKGTNTETGGGSSHNNMPAYQTFYAWRRTA